MTLQQIVGEAKIAANSTGLVTIDFALDLRMFF